MSKWKKKSLKLKRQHNWTAREGCNVFVADRGAVRLDYPRDWVVVPEADSINFYDKHPPDDDCRLAMSYLRLAPVDWSELPLAKLVEVGMKSDHRGIHTWGEIISAKRGGLELAWREVGFLDSIEKREAFSRLCIARQRLIQCLITFEFWVDDAARCVPVWNTVLETLVLGFPIDDPTRGPQTPKWN